jgi:hypothetical protein
MHASKIASNKSRFARGVSSVVIMPNVKLTDRRPFETLVWQTDVRGGGSVERLVR